VNKAILDYSKRGRPSFFIFSFRIIRLNFSTLGGVLRQEWSIAHSCLIYPIRKGLVVLLQNQKFLFVDPSNPSRSDTSLYLHATQGLDTMVKQLFDGVYEVEVEGYGEQLATLNLVPGVRSYGERLVKTEVGEMRVWDPYRSKLAAAIKKGIRVMPISRGSRVLYLGAAAGTTVSHVSDIVGPLGVVYAVEFSARSIRELLVSCEKRVNVVPILADARQPMRYRKYVDCVDVVYVDIAQPDQAELTVENARIYLKRNGWVVLNIKARSVDVAVDPRKVYEQQKRVLTESGFTVVEDIELAPYEKDHDFIVAKLNA